MLLAGTWHFDPARSTELSPWKNYELTISLRDSVEVVPLDVLLKLAAGAKTYRTRFQLPSDPVGRNP